jgi:hypothetical protein
MLAIIFQGVEMVSYPLLRTALPVLIAAGLPALASAQGSLADCRAIPDSAARLACYDRLPLPGTPAAAPHAPAAPAAIARPPAATGQVPAAPVAPAAPAGDASRFGLPAPPPVVESIQSEIPGHFDGWYANSRIRLANGQVWQVTDGTSRFANLQNPKVTVRSGALGSFFLEIEGVKPSPRVRRIE